MGYMGQQLDWGQVFPLAGSPNDAKLIRLGYIRECDLGESELAICPECGGRFTGHDAKIDHVRLRHRQLTAQQEEEMEERIERKVEQASPLYLDQTIASRR